MMMMMMIIIIIIILIYCNWVVTRCSPASKVKKKAIHTQYNKYTSDNNTRKTTTTIHTVNQQQLQKRQLKTSNKQTIQIRILQHVQKVKTPKQQSNVYSSL